MRTPSGSLSLRTLASGSSGNLAVVRSRRTTLLLDFGLPSQLGIKNVLRAAGVNPTDIAAALVSHEHTDHLGYAGLRLLLDQGVPILGARETMSAAWRLHEARTGRPVPENAFLEVVPGSTYLLGDIEVTPFRVSHDVPTCGFRFAAGEGGDRRCAVVATDLGCAPDALLAHFAGADAVFLEANYNDDLLRKSPRHPVHKGRVAGDRGHLSNVQSGSFLRRLADAGTLPRAVMLCHLSEDHNDPGLARMEVGGASGLEARVGLEAAPRHEPGPEVDL